MAENNGKTFAGIPASSVPTGIFGFLAIFGSVLGAVWLSPFPTRQEYSAHNATIELEITGLDQRLAKMELEMAQSGLVVSDTREKVVALTAKFEDFKTFIQLQSSNRKENR